MIENLAKDLAAAKRLLLANGYKVVDPVEEEQGDDSPEDGRVLYTKSHRTYAVRDSAPAIQS